MLRNFLDRKVSIVKFTPPALVKLRKDKDVIRWRASGKNGTINCRATLAEMRDRGRYQKKCETYINKMVKLIIDRELEEDIDLDLKPTEYYYKRYDVTAVECKILVGAIYGRLH